MGLLDDAIREHLELKRLRGADPGEVAREQREALDPVPRDDPASPEQDSPAAEGLAPEMIGETAPVGASRAVTDLDLDLAGAPPAPPGAELSDDPPTAELDMRSVLDETQGTAAEAASRARPIAADSVEDIPAAGHPDEDSLEWEVPGESVARPATAGRNRELPLGDENRGGSARNQADTAQNAEEVILDAREPQRDAPEQERLWLEQRPPRDLDFDS
jgi:hypothetical protein